MKKTKNTDIIWESGEVSRETRFLRKPFYSMSGVPLRAGDKLLERDDLFNTDGCFWICYVQSSQWNQDRKFKILAASTNIHLKPNRFYNYNDFVKKADTNPYLKFVRDYTYLSRRLFKIAKEHESVRIPFAVNIEKYLNSFYPEGTRLVTDDVLIFNKKVRMEKTAATKMGIKLQKEDIV